MRLTICLMAAVAFCVSSMPAQAKTAAKHAAFQINETSWTYTRKGTHVKQSIDADGNYIAQSTRGKHLDHGTGVMKDNKACFTSAMNKEGEVCWTTPRYAVAIGHSFVTRSDKGEKLRVTRIKYTVLKMPA